MNETPELRARREIDRQPEACGWLIQSMDKLNIAAGPGIAVREFKLQSGYADYLLYLNQQAASPVIRQQIEKLARTSAGIYKVAQSDLGQIAIPVPPADEQARIVELLDEALVNAERSEIEIERSLSRAATLRQAILKRAFSGRLLPQDPTDEPASLLLERIRQARADAATGLRSGKRGKRESGSPAGARTAPAGTSPARRGRRLET